MFRGGNRLINPEFEVPNNTQALRPYNNALNDYTQGLCKSLNLDGNDVCLFESRLAFDCILRKKVSKMGLFDDNIGKC